MRPRCLTLVVACAVVSATEATAEEASRTQGPRVRVTSAAAPSGRLVGTLVGLDDDALTVRPSKESGDVRLKRDSIAGLEVSRRRGNRGKAIGLGILAGAALGAAVGAATTPDDSWFTKGEGAGAVAILGAPLGALLGLGFSHGEKWETTTPDRLRVAILPVQGGAGVSLAFGF